MLAVYLLQIAPGRNLQSQKKDSTAGGGWVSVYALVTVCANAAKACISLVVTPYIALLTSYELLSHSALGFPLLLSLAIPLVSLSAVAV
jgi:hypothetical protein